MECVLCKETIEGKIIYCDHEEIVAYLNHPEDKLARKNELFRICKNCQKKHKVKAI